MRIDRYPLGSWAPYEAERREFLLARGARVSHTPKGAVVTWPDGTSPVRLDLSAAPTAPATRSVSRTAAPARVTSKGAAAVTGAALASYIFANGGLTKAGIARLTALSGLSAKEIGCLRERSLSESAMATLFESLYQLWQSGKISEEDFNEALSLLLAGVDPTKSLLAIGHLAEDITFDVRCRKLNAIRDFFHGPLLEAAYKRLNHD